jgi:hypothetical protein
MMYEDDREFESLARTIRELDPPPPPPRGAMWARIQAQRSAQQDSATQQDAQVIALPVNPRGRMILQWGAALAAMLVIGIGLGRFSLQQATTSTPHATTAAAPASPADDAAGPYRLAATQHLQRTEMLLTSLSIDAPPNDAQEVSAWARDLLTNTRLLLASPVAEDAATRRLLEDLELVLAQIAAIPAAKVTEEVELIQDGLNQSDVLLRLRVATTVRRTVGT